MKKEVRVLDIGEVFGRLTIKEFLGPGKWRKPIYRCECKCGKEVITNSYVLINKQTRSCGCIQKEKATITGENKKLKGGNSTENAIYKNYIRSAKRRNLDWSLTKDDFSSLCAGNCFYCNIEPSQESHYNHCCTPFIYNGIDRVDNDLGYIKENCVSCCRTCNVAKLQMSLEEFKTWISKVYNNIINK